MLFVTIVETPRIPDVPETLCKELKGLILPLHPPETDRHDKKLKRKKKFQVATKVIFAKLKERPGAVEWLREYRPFSAKRIVLPRTVCQPVELQ